MKSEILIIVGLFLGLYTFGQKDFGHLAPTPPLGWNSWDCYGMDVTDDQMKATAHYMDRYLKRHGWEYVVLDMGWFYGEGLNTSNFSMENPPQYIDEYGRLIPALRKFPSAADGRGLKPLGDYIHSLGLKFGIHIIRGIPINAVEQNTPIKGTQYRAKDIVGDRLCGFYKGMYNLNMYNPGAEEYYESLIELYTEWGVDYLKVDCILSPYHTKEIEAIRKAIEKYGNKIVLSLSAHVRIADSAHVSKNSNLWRISGDMWDHWSYVLTTFDLCRDWQDYITPGYWPDCDMLPFGKLRMNGTDGALARRIKLSKEETLDEYSRLTADETYSVMGLWSIFRSPLMMGGDMLQLDDLSFKLLTNREVIEMNQNSTNNHELRATDDEIVWVADDPKTRGKYVALFNLKDNENKNIIVNWNELGIDGKYKVRDLWKKKKIAKYKGSFNAEVNPHGCGLYKIY